MKVIHARFMSCMKCEQNVNNERRTSNALLATVIVSSYSPSVFTSELSLLMVSNFSIRG